MKNGKKGVFWISCVSISK